MLERNPGYAAGGRKRNGQPGEIIEKNWGIREERICQIRRLQTRLRQFYLLLGPAALQTANRRAEFRAGRHRREPMRPMRIYGGGSPEK